MTDEERPKHKARGIVAVAVNIGGVTVSMPAPARHHDVMRALYCLGVEDIGPDSQGFLDHRGIFLGRKQARIAAGDFGQLNRAQVELGGDLFSEDLW